MFKKSLPIFLICLVLVGACVGLGYIWKDKNEAQNAAEAETDKKPAHQSYKPQDDKTQENKTDEKTEETNEPLAEKETALSEFATEGDDDANRNTNLAIACEKLDGTLIKAGGTLSFNEAIGPCTADEGYVEAKVLMNGANAGSDIGGGVCQVATTLFNAALRGNLTIVESHRHSAPVTYVPVGMDAMVSDPYKDLVIENPYDEDIVIEAESTGSKVFIRLTGPTLDGKKIEIESIVTAEIPVGGTVYKVTDQLEPGVESMTEEGHSGYKTESYKVVYDEKGEEISRELISQDEYPAVNPVIEVGRSDYNK